MLVRAYAALCPVYNEFLCICTSVADTNDKGTNLMQCLPVKFPTKNATNALPVQPKQRQYNFRLASLLYALPYARS